MGEKEPIMKKQTSTRIACYCGMVLIIAMAVGCGGGDNSNADNNVNADPLASLEGRDYSGVVDDQIIDDNVIVPNDSTLTLNRATVNGNVYVKSGSQFLATNSVINGNVQAFRADLIDLMQGTFVDGDVQGENTLSVLIRDVMVGGNIQIKEAESPMTTDTLLVEFSTVDGDVQAEKSSGRMKVAESHIGGNVQLVENYTGPYEVTGNQIDGDLQFFKNQGEGTITGNEVMGNLQSKENNPRPYINDNVVHGDLEDE
jgi:hypothetical protein